MFSDASVLVGFLLQMTVDFNQSRVQLKLPLEDSILKDLRTFGVLSFSPCTDGASVPMSRIFRQKLTLQLLSLQLVILEIFLSCTR